MATNAPFGFRVRSTVASATWSGAAPIQDYQISPNYNTSIYYGAPVTLSGGYIVPATGNASTPLLGVMNGCQFTVPSNISPVNVQNSIWYPASTTIVANTQITATVLYDPFLVFEIQTDTNPGLTQAMVGSNFDFNVQSGDTSTGYSTVSVRQASRDNTNTGVDLPLKLIGLAKGASGEAYNTGYFIINNHILKANGTTGNA